MLLEADGFEGSGEREILSHEHDLPFSSVGVQGTCWLAEQHTVMLLSTVDFMMSIFFLI